MELIINKSKRIYQIDSNILRKDKIGQKLIDINLWQIKNKNSRHQNDFLPNIFFS